MRVPDLILKCVGFVGEAAHVNADGSVSGDLCATGFFVSIPLTDADYPRAAYFVTAHHVAKDLENKAPYFLVNKKGGGLTYIKRIIGGGWWTHPTDKTADVAIAQVGIPADADIVSVGVEQLGTPERLRELNIGIGDEVHITGLFAPASGQQQNQPIVRTGNVAMMPNEQIQIDAGYADVYLVEARSLGGVSGSPVFVRPTINFRLPEHMQGAGIKNAFWCGHGATLLGLMHGHWDIRESEMNKAIFTHDSKRGVNMGIAIVVPAIKILETLNMPVLMAIRDEMKKHVERGMVPAKDSLKTKDEELTEIDFERVLKQVSRKIEPSASDKPRK
jgi:hypothetical protein